MNANDTVIKRAASEAGLSTSRCVVHIKDPSVGLTIEIPEFLLGGNSLNWHLFRPCMQRGGVGHFNKAGQVSKVFSAVQRV